MVAKYKKIVRRLETMKRFQDITKAIRFITGGELAKIRKEINKRFSATSSFIPLIAKKFTTFKLKKIESKKNKYKMRFEPSDSQARNKNKGILLIPFCDDRGNCGTHNINVLTRTLDLTINLKSNNMKPKVFPIGLQAKNFCEDHFKRDIIGSIINLGDIKLKLEICFFYVQYLIKYNFNVYYFILNRFYTMEEQVTILYRICNFKDFFNSVVYNTMTRYHVYFDSIVRKVIHTRFMEDLYNFSFSMFLLEAFNDNKYSFLGSRYTAMDEMVNNSQEIIEKLTLIYNKLRQEHITTEMIEIISAKNAVVESSD